LAVYDYWKPAEFYILPCDQRLCRNRKAAIPVLFNSRCGILGGAGNPLFCNQELARALENRGRLVDQFYLVGVLFNVWEVIKPFIKPLIAAHE
jgi:hypothetical protein